MKVYALLFNYSDGECRLPSARTHEESVSFNANEFDKFVELFPDLWTVYEFELDEKDLCDM